MKDIHEAGAILLIALAAAVVFLAFTGGRLLWEQGRALEIQNDIAEKAAKAKP